MDGKATLSKIDMQASAVFKGKHGRAHLSPRQGGGQLEEWHGNTLSVRSSPIKQFCSKCRHPHASPAPFLYLIIACWQSQMNIIPTAVVSTGHISSSVDQLLQGDRPPMTVVSSSPLHLEKTSFFVKSAPLSQG